jgi:hypothetical protein
MSGSQGDAAGRPSRLIATALALGLLGACRPGDTRAPASAPANTLPAGQYSPRPQENKLQWPAHDADRLRADALRRMQVWRAPAVPVREADLSANPPGPDAFSREEEVTCRFLLKDSEGLTPKFHCVLKDGEVVKVKYGRRNPEVFAEAAATRLLRALGFGADPVYVVRAVRCVGCPAFPYPRLEILDAIQMDEGRTTVFQMATVERRSPGLEIEGSTKEGWGFFELDQVSPRHGGAPRADIDALRLLAVFLAHWDNKPVNQSLVCPSGEETRDPPGCRAPFAVVHDLGKTFGPRGVDLQSWGGGSVWADPTGCRLSMKGMPFDGASFADTTITEAGRRKLAGMLGELSDEQLRALFRGARFPELGTQSSQGKDVEAWIAAFRGRVGQIAGRSCPK